VFIGNLASIANQTGAPFSFAGQFDRKLNSLVSVVVHLYVFGALLGGEHFVRRTPSCHSLHPPRVFSL